MLMGTNGWRNDGSIRPANDGATAPNMQQLHHRLGHINRTLHTDTEKPTTLEKTFNYLHKINSYVFMKKIIILMKKIAFDCWHNTVLWYTTHKTQHKIQLVYNFLWNIFWPFLERWCVWFELVGLGTGGSWTVCWQRQKMVVRVRCTQPSLHSPHS